MEAGSFFYLVIIFIPVRFGIGGVKKMEDILVSNPSDLTFDVLVMRVSPGDERWILFMLSLGETWIISGDKQNNRRNIYLSMKQYWKGTFNPYRK